MYELWYYYRAFDQTKTLDTEKIDKEMTLKRCPSKLSKTLEYNKPNLVRNQTRAIVEQTGKVPPKFSPTKVQTTVSYENHLFRTKLKLRVFIFRR